MSKNIVVIFTPTNARLLVNPENIELYKNCDNCLINPDLSSVKGIPPQYWKLHGDKIIPMDRIDKAIRNRELKKGCINSFTINSPTGTNYRLIISWILFIIGLGLFLTSIIL